MAAEKKDYVLTLPKSNDREQTLRFASLANGNHCNDAKYVPKGDIEAGSKCWCSPKVALFRSTSFVEATFARSANSFAPAPERVGSPKPVWLSVGLPTLHQAAIIADKFAEWYNWVVQWPSETV